MTTTSTLSFFPTSSYVLLPFLFYCPIIHTYIQCLSIYLSSSLPVQINDSILGVLYNLNLSHGFDPSKPLKKKKKKKLSSLYLSLFFFQSWVLVFLPPKSVALTATTPTTTQPPQPSITTAEREQNHKQRQRRRRRRRRQLRRNTRLRVIRDRPKRMRGIHIS